MNLYLVQAPENWVRDQRRSGRLCYVRAVVAAPDERSARLIYPGDSEPGWTVWNPETTEWDDGTGDLEVSWPHPAGVRVRLIAEDTDIPDGVVVAQSTAYSRKNIER